MFISCLRKHIALNSGDPDFHFYGLRLKEGGIPDLSVIVVLFPQTAKMIVTACNV